MKLTIAQIACALELPQGKIERWIRQGRIPLARRENICTFDRTTLERWAAQHSLSFQPEGRRKQECGMDGDLGLSAALQNGGVYYDVDGTRVPEVFASAVDRMTVIPVSEKSRLVKKLEERERLASTGVGQGIALPHPREPESLGLCAPAVAACFLATPVDFKAVDGLPVSILFILLSPDVRTHLQILSRLSFCLRQELFVAFLKQKPTPEALTTRLDQMEGLTVPATGEQRPR